MGPDIFGVLSMLGGGQPGFAGGMIPTPQGQTQPNFAPIQMPPPQQQAPPPHSRGDTVLGNIAGMIGDALLAANGRQPIYRTRMMQQRQNHAVGNYLGKLDPALAQMLMTGNVDADTAVKLFEYQHPKPSADPDIIREMRAAGIDPTSEEGKGIIRQHVGSNGTDPSSIRVLQSMGIDPKSTEGQRLLYGSLSPSGYLLTPPSGSHSGGSQGLPKVNSPDEAKKLPPGSKFIMPDGRVGTVPGGPTATPSGGF